MDSPETVMYLYFWYTRFSLSNAFFDLALVLLKCTVTQIEKALINDRLRVLKVSENFAIQLFIILQ